LDKVGVKAGQIVSIMLEHCVDLYPAFIGCMIRGFVPTFLPPLTIKQDPDIFRRSLAKLFERISPAAVITSAKNVEQIPGGIYSVLQVEELVESEGEGEDAVELAMRMLNSPLVSNSETAFLQHSSGTTGLKKGVMLSHRAVIEQIIIYSNSIGADVGDVIVSWLPLYHDMGLITSFLLPMVFGNTVVSMDALEWVVKPTILLDYIERYRAALVWLPNFAFHHIIRAAGKTKSWDLRSLKNLINCSEPCRSHTFEEFVERFAPMGIHQTKLRVCYAMAENVFAVSQTPLGSLARSGGKAATRPFLSSGRPIDGVEVDIRASDGSSVASGELGEICFRSTTMFEGYFKQPQVTAERIQRGWFHTSDLGCIEGGELFVLGRVDDLLIINGKNLFAHEIESQLTAIIGIAPGRTLAFTDFDEKIGATRLVILGEAASEEADIKALEAEIRQAVLGQTGIFPSAVHFLPRGFLVKSSSGKIARGESYRKFKAYISPMAR
jgi:acyl-CoA synthetase (AMP-forming)/AMP-acid ligase II